ncbi:MAG: hypothetical protein IVW56_07180 [Candidatus Binataceae bacterium]|nr:hypothetical protein [Candidatus Binataceae bacterium]
MKPRNREVNIFNMSVLDLLTGALGAFCFLTLALFPAYFKSRNPSAASQQNKFEKTKQGIPAFSLAELYVSDALGHGCGAFKLGGLQAPNGNKSFRQLPLAAGPEAAGYDTKVYLFLFDTGSYLLTTTAFGQGAGCHVWLRQHTPQGSLQGGTIVTESPASYPFKLEVKPEQLITSILPSR